MMRFVAMKRILTDLCITLLISITSGGTAWAQATAQISGIVQDPSGAVLPGVEIIATQTQTGISRMTGTNETGSYVLPNLPLGPYKLEASLPGFRAFVQTGIVLQVNSNPTINVALQVGQVSEQVEVQANAALVDTRSLSVGQVMETARIMELPLNGRNAQELVVLQGGAAQFAPAGGQAYPGRLFISSAGNLGTSTEYTLDGARYVDVLDGLPMLLPFPDALSEFRTEIAGMTASQGKGTQVSAVTKSGTNEFHGDLFEFNRNDLFNARNYFAAKGSTLKRNQFGGTFGGPIMKNKLFFFGGYQETTLRQDPNDILAFVPTAAMLGGDFTAFTAPACNGGRQITLRAPFVNNRIDPSLFSPTAVNVAGRLPHSIDPCGQIRYGAMSTENDGQVVTKVDYQASAKHSLFGRYMHATYKTPSPFQFTPDNILNAATNGNQAFAHAFTFGSTYLLNATTVNAFRLSYSMDHRYSIKNEYFSAEDMGSKVYSGYVGRNMGLVVSSGFTLGGGNPNNFVGNLYQLADDVSLTRGTHQFGFGGRLAEARATSKHWLTAGPSFTTNGSATGTGLSDFLMGKLSDFNQGLPAAALSYAKFFSLYGQDTWQVKPRLSMSYGVRWAPVFPIVDYHRPTGMVLNFDTDRFNQGVRSSVYKNAPPGMLFPGDPGFVQSNNGADLTNPKSDLWNPYWKEFAPRVGLAWDVRGDGRTSLRASYGVAYEETPTNTRLGTAISMPPWGQFTRLLAPVGGLDNPWLGFSGANPFPINVTRDVSFVPAGEYMGSTPNLSPTYTQSWNLSLQREVVPGTLLSVSYLGTEITHLTVANPYNLANFVPGVGDANGNCFLNGKLVPYTVAPGTACSMVSNTQSRRTLSLLNPTFGQEIGRFSTLAFGGTQSYNGMIVSLQRRARHGLSLNVNYTLSHCIGDFMGRQFSGYGTSADHTYQDPNNRRKDRGNCEVDQRNNFNVTALAETPKFANRTLAMLGTGWRLSGLYRIGTGGSLQSTLNPTSGIRTATLGNPNSSQNQAVSVDQCLCDVSGQRPDQVLPNVYLDRSGRPNTQWLNPKAFALPALGTLGNLGRTTLTLPVRWQFDLALSRAFHIHESQSLEFRAEAFNLLNKFRPGIINTQVTAASFGKINTALDPRIMQFALKFLF